MEQKILISSTASGLNQQIAEHVFQGWKPVGSHLVVPRYSYDQYAGNQHRAVNFENEYSQSMNRNDGHEQMERYTG